MNSQPKVLIVDKTSDRKTRIAAIKARGFAVFPTLNLQEARSRCRPGAYDLIVVNGTLEPEAAVAFCDQLRERKPPQAVLLTIAKDSGAADRDYIVADSPEELADKVEGLLQKPSAESGAAPNQQEKMPARAA